MRELITRLPFKWYVDLANNKKGWDGNVSFLDLLIPALKTLEDDDVTLFIEINSFNYSALASQNKIFKILNAYDIAIVREYVRRRLKSIEAEEKEAEVKLQIEKAAHAQNWYIELKDSPYIGQLISAYKEREFAHYINDISKYQTFSTIFKDRLSDIREIEKREKAARESILKARADLQKDPSYTGIQPKQVDPTVQAQEDMYSNFTVDMFQAEIDDLCKRSLEAQFDGDGLQSSLLSAKASSLSARKEALEKKLNSIQSVNNNLLGGSYPNSSNNPINLEMLTKMYENLKKKGII